MPRLILEPQIEVAGLSGTHKESDSPVAQRSSEVAATLATGGGTTATLTIGPIVFALTVAGFAALARQLWIERGLNARSNPGQMRRLSGWWRTERRPSYSFARAPERRSWAGIPRRAIPARPDNTTCCFAATLRPIRDSNPCRRRERAEITPSFAGHFLPTRAAWSNPGQELRTRRRSQDNSRERQPGLADRRRWPQETRSVGRRRRPRSSHGASPVLPVRRV